MDNAIVNTYGLCYALRVGQWPRGLYPWMWNNQAPFGAHMIIPFHCVPESGSARGGGASDW